MFDIHNPKLELFGVFRILWATITVPSASPRLTELFLALTLASWGAALRYRFQTIMGRWPKSVLSPLGQLQNFPSSSKLLYLPNVFSHSSKMDSLGSTSSVVHLSAPFKISSLAIQKVLTFTHLTLIRMAWTKRCELVKQRKEYPRKVSWYVMLAGLSDVPKATVIYMWTGAGTILDGMRLGLSLVVVPNSSLLDNHQDELAEELEKQGYATKSDTA